MTDRIARTISQRLSLRKPQSESLEILADVVSRIELSKGGDPATALAAIRDFYPTVEDFGHARIARSEARTLIIRAEIWEDAAFCLEDAIAAAKKRSDSAEAR